MKLNMLFYVMVVATLLKSSVEGAYASFPEQSADTEVEFSVSVYFADRAGSPRH